MKKALKDWTLFEVQELCRRYDFCGDCPMSAHGFVDSSPWCRILDLGVEEWDLETEVEDGQEDR